MQLSTLTLLFCVAITSIACQASDPSSKPIAPRVAALTPEENQNMHERNVMLVQRAKDNADAKLVFLGDSITQGWDGGGNEAWTREFGAYDPLNLGVSGDRTEHVLWRLAQGSYDHLRPKTIVIMIGTNNTGHRMDPPADIAAGVEEILAQLTQRFPKAKLVLLSIFPRGESAEDPSRLNNDAANKLLLGIAKQRGVESLDLTRAFTDAKGTLVKDLMPDFLHPNARGYDVWANAIRDPLKRWMQ